MVYEIKEDDGSQPDGCENKVGSLKENRDTATKENPWRRLLGQRQIGEAGGPKIVPLDENGEKPSET